jgi:hypothetical protein
VGFDFASSRKRQRRELLGLVVEMEVVEEAMEDGGEEEGDGGEEDDAAEEGVEGGEEFGGVGAHGIDGAHAGEDHGGIEEGVDPRQACEVMVTEDADAECDGNDSDCDEEGTQHAANEVANGEELIGTMFEHTRG